MSLFSATSLIIFFASIGFAAFLYYGNRKSFVNRTWLVLSFATGVWGLALFGVTTSVNSTVALYWQYLLDVAASFIPTLYYIFISVFLGLSNKRFRMISISISLLMVFFSFSSYFKVGVFELERLGFYWINPGSLYLIFPIFFALYFLLSIYELLKKYFSTQDPGRKAQILSVTLVSSIGLMAGGSNFFPQFSDIYPFGNYFLLLYIFFMSYGVLRYKLMSVKVISAQLFSGSIVLILLFNFLNAKSLRDSLFSFFIFLAVSIFSLFLIKSVNKEVRAREQIEKLAKDLRVANERLHKINMLKTEFVSLATHQLRSPLTAIKGYASMLLEGSYGKVEDAMREPLERIATSTTTLSQVVQDFLDVSRIEQGSMKYDMKAFSFKDLVEEVVMEQGPNIEKSGLDFEFDVQDDSIAQNGYITYGDRSKLKQVIMNLIDNSLKYTKEGFVKVLLTYTSKAIILRIVDSGIGIDEKTLPALFQKFERADGADEVNVQGTGLGLYIARQIMEAHGGTISASSEGLGKGSTFTVELKRIEF